MPNMTIYLSEAENVEIRSFASRYKITPQRLMTTLVKKHMASSEEEKGNIFASLKPATRAETSGLATESANQRAKIDTLERSVEALRRELALMKSLRQNETRSQGSDGFVDVIDRTKEH